MGAVTVLGAGAMGSALCRPFVDAGWEVRLWGTWLDDHLIDAIDAGQDHPRLGVPVAEGVITYRANQLSEALAGTDVVAMSVASVGVPRITELALLGMSNAKAILLTSKGFYRDGEGRINLLPDAIRSIARDHGVTIPPIVAIAGPVKANELAASKTTSTVFGCLDSSVAVNFARSARTDYYAIEPSGDERGIEVCAPMKNVYAIGLGIADGLGEAGRTPRHNLRAAIFTQAIREMSILSEALGAHPGTATGLAGVGDLEVTGLSGRNKFYGVRLGKGESQKEALAEMERLEQTVEGVPAAELAGVLVDQLGDVVAGQLPLMGALRRILSSQEHVDVLEVISPAVLPPCP